jgi:hypothetical protein
MMRKLIFRGLAAALLLAPIPRRAQPVTSPPEFGNYNITAKLVDLTAAGVGTYDSADQGNRYSRGANISISFISETTASVIVAIQGKDTTTGTYFDICATNALTAVGFTLMTVYPGTATSGVKSGANCNGPLSGIWRIEVRVSGSNPNLTLSVGVGLVL